MRVVVLSRERHLAKSSVTNFRDTTVAGLNFRSFAMSIISAVKKSLYGGFAQ